MTDETKKQENEAAEAPAEELAETLASEPAAQGEAAPETVAGPDIAAIEAENADLRDRLLRAAAEMENTRKRAEREKQDAARYANAGFGRDMLEVSDNLRRALKTLKQDERDAAGDSLKAMIEGVEMTERLLTAALERNGIREITPEPGERFDPNHHEAMFEVPGTGQPAGTVVHVLEAGYRIGDRLLRAARVGVAKDDGGAQNGSKVDTTA